jgi:hypothetical protein
VAFAVEDLLGWGLFLLRRRSSFVALKAFLFRAFCPAAPLSVPKHVSVPAITLRHRLFSSLGRRPRRCACRLDIPGRFCCGGAVLSGSYGVLALRSPPSGGATVSTRYHALLPEYSSAAAQLLALAQELGAWKALAFRAPHARRRKCF